MNTQQASTQCHEDTRMGQLARDTMSARLPEITRTLRNDGVVRVVAGYQWPYCLILFFDKEGETVQPSISPTMTVELSQVFRSAMKRRSLRGADVQSQRGCFEWDVLNDVLTHEHTVIYQGL